MNERVDGSLGIDIGHKRLTGGVADMKVAGGKSVFGPTENPVKPEMGPPVVANEEGCVG